MKAREGEKKGGRTKGLGEGSGGVEVLSRGEGGLACRQVGCCELWRGRDGRGCCCEDRESEGEQAHGSCG